MPQNYGPPLIDFSSLASLPQVFNQAQDQARQRMLLEQRQKSLADLAATGNLDPQKIGLASLMTGDSQGALAAAQLAQTQGDRLFDRQYKTRSLDLQTAIANRKEVPAGFRQTAQGGYEYIPGGPQDPALLKAQNEAKDKGKQLGFSDINKLSEEGAKFSSVNQFANTFEDRFAGYKLPAAGNAMMMAGRNLPEGVVGKDIAEGAAFWQGYDRYKNIVRNDLFGSALTPSEQAAFEKADVSPGMEPKQIRRNLSEQKRIVEAGLQRKASALVAGGYSADVIGKAYGVPVEKLGVVAPAKATSGGLTADKLVEGKRYKGSDGRIYRVINGQAVPE